MPGRGFGFDFARFYNSKDGTSGPLGFGWTHSYNVTVAEDSAARTLLIRWGDGHEDIHDEVGGVYVARTPGVHNEVTKNGDGTWTVVMKDRRSWQFRTDGRLNSIVDRNGNTLSLAYDGANQLATVTDTLGRVVTFTYDGAGRIVQVTDPWPRTVSVSYDGAGDLASVTDARGGVTTFTYDGSHRMLTAVDPRGNTLLTNVYDTEGRVVQQTNARGRTYGFAYDTPQAGHTTVTDPLGQTSVDIHDLGYRLVRRVDRLGHAVAFTYDPDNNRIEAKDKRGTSPATPTTGEPTSPGRPTPTATPPRSPTTRTTTLCPAPTSSRAPPPSPTTGWGTSPPRQRRWAGWSRRATTSRGSPSASPTSAAR